MPGLWRKELVNRRADGKTQCWGFETDEEIRRESPEHQEWRRAITPERGRVMEVTGTCGEQRG